MDIWLKSFKPRSANSNTASPSCQYQLKFKKVSELVWISLPNLRVEKKGINMVWKKDKDVSTPPERGCVMIFIKRPPTGATGKLFLSNNIHTLTSYILGNFDRIGTQTREKPLTRPCYESAPRVRLIWQESTKLMTHAAIKQNSIKMMNNPVKKSSQCVA